MITTAGASGSWLSEAELSLWIYEKKVIAIEAKMESFCFQLKSSGLAKATKVFTLRDLSVDVEEQSF